MYTGFQARTCATAVASSAAARRRVAPRTPSSSSSPVPPSREFLEFCSTLILTHTPDSNVVIGADQNEGIHCQGPCTIRNVWFEDVCEDAITIRQSSGTSTITGGGAKGAADKVVQHNGGGESHTVSESPIVSHPRIIQASSRSTRTASRTLASCTGRAATAALK